MTTFLDQARCTVRRLGIDVVRYRPAGTVVAHLLKRHEIDLVLDVGAHNGDSGAALRDAGYSGRIVSFEPLRSPRNKLRHRASRERGWSVLPYALGDRRGTATLNIAGSHDASSSILPTLPRYQAAMPHASRTGEVTIETRRLDELWARLTEPGERVFLNLDVQGYEIHVLRGLGVYSRVCAGLRVRTSLVPLHEGELPFDEMLHFAREDLGMTLMSILPGLTDPHDGRMLQCDLVLFDEGGSHSSEGPPPQALAQAPAQAER
ncbi:FkbM family methyltransferase [Streptomyces violascens]|uniref:FkbM family methyltransferase n=1 Tax=Streptomyces violascens TaxID=67381 RepID=UPI00369124AD